MKTFLKAVRKIWIVVASLLLVASLAFNMFIMAGGIALNLASNAYEAVTGKSSVATRHSTEAAALNNELAGQKKMNRKLQTKVASLSDNIALAQKNTVNRMVTHKGGRTTAKAAVLATTAAISKRAVLTAGRGAGSVAGQAIPYIGTTVIVGVTTLELYDLCQTVKDMNELSHAFDPTLEPNDDQATVCSIEIPSKEEVWETMKTSPGQAWTGAKHYVSKLPTWAEIKPHIPNIDWNVSWSSIQSGSKKFVEDGLEGMGNVYEGVGDLIDNLVFPPEPDMEASDNLAWPLQRRLK